MRGVSRGGVELGARTSASGSGAVDSVNGQTGTVVLDAGDVDAVADKNYVTDAQLTVIGNTSGANTGDQDLSSLAPKDAPTFTTSITGSYLTASEMLISGADKKVISAPVATYPSLTELTYVKGVTSAIQTQLDALGGRYAQFMLFESDASVSTGNGIGGFAVPSDYNGMNLVDATATVHTKGITGATDVQVRRRRTGTDADMLSTKVTIGDEFFASDGVIDTANDDLATGDQIYIDVDAVHSGTAPLGLSVVLTFELP